MYTDKVKKKHFTVMKNKFVLFMTYRYTVLKLTVALSSIIKFKKLIFNPCIGKM